MCNLHDISWGNRPTGSEDTNMLTINAKKAAQLKSNYMVFRVNFLAFWILSNTVFCVVINNYTSISTYTEKDGLKLTNDGEMTFLQVFALFLASIVVFRVLFASVSIVKFKFLYNHVLRYSLYKFDLYEEAKRLRSEAENWDESILETDMALLENNNDPSRIE